MSRDKYIIPVFVPHLGCPHDCVFCNQEEITGSRRKITGVEVGRKVDQYLTTIPVEASMVEVAFYGGSFTGIEKEYQKELLSMVHKRLKKDLITGIRLSTRPDYITRGILDFLKEYGVTVIELGVQSLDNNVLKASGRGHTREDVVTAVKLIREYDFKLGLQMMPGLPDSTAEIDLKTGQEIVGLAPDFVRIYPTLVIKGTELARLYDRGEYTPLSLNKAVKISAELLKEFRREKIEVIRIGLQPSEGVSKEQVVAGPFHPAIRQLVESKILLEKIEEELKMQRGNELDLRVNPRDISNLRGQHNSNISYLYQEYNFDDIRIKEDDSLIRGAIEVDMD